MSVFDSISLFWVLPFLVVLLVIIYSYRNDPVIPKKPEDLDSEDWFIVLVCSILYPIGIIALTFHFVPSIVSTIIKER